MNYYDQFDLNKFKKKKQITTTNRQKIIFNILRGLQYLHI